MFEDNSNLIRTLEKYRSSIDEDEFSMNISIHKKFYQEIIEEKLSKFKLDQQQNLTIKAKK